MAGGNGLIYLGLGAAIMYLMGPQNGRKRRAEIKNQMDSAARKVKEGQETVVRDATNRAYGAVAESRRWVERHRQMRQARLPGDGAMDSASGMLASMGGPWSPSSRAAAGALGAGMVTYGYFRGGIGGFI